MLNYSNQPTQMIIGTKSGTTYAPVTLEIAYSTPATIRTGGISRIVFDVVYTVGAGETTNSIELKVEFSPDGTNWYQAVNDSTSTGTSTLTQREFTFAGAAAGAYKFDLPLTISNLYTRISVKETGVASNKGTASVEITLCE